MRKVAVLDAGSGNIRSVMYALQRVGAEAFLSADAQEINKAAGLVVPGVGASRSVLEKLQACGADKIIRARIASERSVIGICVGMQLLFAASTEHGGCRGFGIWPGEVTALSAPIIPHMGWSPVKAGAGTKLLAGIENERFYFVHSYAVQSDSFSALRKLSEQRRPVISTANYGSEFVAAIEEGALAAVQFHPEKSAQAGMQLWENWVNNLA